LATASSDFGVYSEREVLWVLRLQRKPQPNIEEVGKLGVMQQITEWRIGNDQINASVRKLVKIGGRAT
jgi:hypothetical protein